MAKKKLVEKQVKTFPATGILIVFAVVFGFILTYFNRQIYGSQYFNDENKIIDYMQSESTLNQFTFFGGIGANKDPNSGSFLFAAWLYSHLGLPDNPRIVSILTYLLFVLFLFLIYPYQKLIKAAPSALVFFSFLIFFSTFYINMYTKEAFVTVLIFLFCMMIKIPGGEVAWIAIALLYAAGVRQYWFFVIAVYILMRALTILFMHIKKLNSLFMLLLSALLISFVLFYIVFPLAQEGQGLVVGNRISVNENRDTSSVGSVIVDQNTGSSFPIQLYNYLYMFVTFVFPVTLLLRGSASYLLYFFIFAGVWSFVFINYNFVFKKIKLGYSSKNLRLATKCFALAYSYLLVQITFEPDYGSYIRHLLSVLLAVFFALKLIQDDRKKNSLTYNGRRRVIKEVRIIRQPTSEEVHTQ
ncbi:MAG: hypothetical protein QM571_04740 [Micrococcaceae bacterium]